MRKFFLSIALLCGLSFTVQAAVLTLDQDITGNGMYQRDVFTLFTNFVTVINELVVDHATNRTNMTDTETLIEEMHDDHATNRTNMTDTETLIEEMHDDHATTKAFTDEIDTDHDKMNDYLHYVGERDGVIGGDLTFSAGAAVTLTGAGRVTYRIGGNIYTADVDTTITLEDNGDVTQSKYGAWRVLIDKSGVVTTQDPAGSGAMAFDASEDALLSLSQRAISSNTVEIGYLTLIDTDSVHNIGTNNLNASGVTTTIHTVTGPRLNAGLTAALGSSFTADNGVATWDSGTIDARIEGGTSVVFSRNLAQISAITNQAMDDADTVGGTQFGGWLMVTDEAATGVYALASDGIAGTVSAMTHASAAARDTALDDVQNRLPAIFASLGRILLFNTSGGNAWVAATDNWDHDTAVATVTDYTFGEFARITLVGDVGRDAPTVPASLTAASPATLSSSKPASPAATLSSSKPASPAATLTNSTALTLSAP